MTYIPDFIKALGHLIKIDARGVFNIAAKGGLRYPDLLDVYKKRDSGFQYTVIPLKNLKVDRTNLLLSVSKLEKTGFKVRPAGSILEECVKGYTTK